MEGSEAKGVLFDKDGTLIDFERTWFPIVREALERLRKRFGLSEAALHEAAYSSGLRDDGFAKDSLLQSATTGEIARRWSRIIRSHNYPVDALEIERILADTANEMASAAVPVPGVLRLLERLKSRGFRLGVATSDVRPSTEAGLSHVGILHLFDFIAADGDGYPAKPAPDAAFAFASRCCIDRASIVVFGDSAGDLSFARNSGARFVGMRTGCNRVERFLDAGYPVISDFRDIRAVERLIASPRALAS